MPKSQPVSVRLTQELNKKIEAIAKSLDRPKSWAIAQAVEEYVEVQEWHLKAIEDGIAAADRGEFVSHEEVKRWIEEGLAPDKRPKPK